MTVYIAFDMKALALLTLTLSLTAASHADSLRTQVEASNKAIHKAMMKKDFTELAKVMRAAVTSDFKYVEAGNTMNFDQMMSNMKAGLGSLKTVTTARSVILNLKSTGTKATGTTTHTMGGTMVGPDKKSHVMAFMGTSNDSYVKRGSSWKLSKMVWTANTMTMDGKPYDPTKG